MEFAELIKTPKLDRIQVSYPIDESMEATLCITSHHLIVSSRTDSSRELWVRFDSIQKKPKLVTLLPI